MSLSCEGSSSTEVWVGLDLEGIQLRTGQGKVNAQKNFHLVLSSRFYQPFKNPEIYILTDVNLNKSFEVHSSFSLGSNINYRVSICSIMKAELTFVVMYEPELCVPGIISFLSGMSPITSRSFHIHEGFNSKQLVAITLRIRRIL